MMELSVLELLHPDGVARTSLVLGSNCPESLFPKPQMGHAGDTDLVILAPSAEQCSSKGWLAAAVRSMSQGLSPDGVGYVLVAPRWRWLVMRLLHKAGLLMDASFWHFPNELQSRYLVPMDCDPAQFALDTILTTPALKRALALQMFRTSSTRQLLAATWRPVGISVRRSGARPLFKWLFQSGKQRPFPTSAIVRTSWRGLKGASIAYGFSGGDACPSVIAKTVAAEDMVNTNREARVLDELGPAARRAGMRVPEVLRKQQNDRQSSLLLSFIPGRSVSDLLVSNPGMFPEVMTRIVDWLERWHTVTAMVRPLTSEGLEQALLAPLARLAPLLQGAEGYRNWLVESCQVVHGNPVPLVATHNDLTMANVLLDEHDQLGVVDWETGCPGSWPLLDFYYAATDAVRITAKCTNWLDAFKACCLPGGAYAARVRTWEGRLQSAIGPPPAFEELCFHACWLHHASNEHETSQPGKSRPFLEIVQWLVSHEFKFKQNHN